MLIRKTFVLALLGTALSAANVRAASADLHLDTMSLDSPVRIGKTTSGGVMLRNDGPDPAQNVVVTLQVPAGSTLQITEGRYFDNCIANGGTVTCSSASIPASSNRPIGVTATATGLTDGQLLTMTATVTSGTPDPVSANNSASVSATAIGATDLSVSGSFVPYNAGEDASVTLTMTNNGPYTARKPAIDIQMNSYWYGDDQYIKAITQTGGPAGTVYRNGQGASAQAGVPSLAAGESASFRLTIKTMSIRASIYLYTFVYMANENSGSNSVINFRVKPDALADLAPVSTAPATVFTGDNIPFAVQVRSRGPSDAEGVTVTWSVPANTSFVSLDVYPFPTSFNCTSLSAGATSGTITCSNGYADIIASNIYNPSKLTFTVKANAPATVTNRATATSTTRLTNTADDFTEKVTTVTTPAAAFDGSVSITPSAARVRPSAPLSYTIRVSNAGPGTITSGTVAVALPAGFNATNVSPAGACSGNFNCAIASLASGASTTITIAGTAPASPANVAATATLSAAGDTNGANNSATANVVVQHPADLALTLSADKTAVISGGQIHFNLSVRNAGPGPADDTRIVAELPPGALWIQSYGNDTCSGTSVITCTFGTLASGSTITMTLAVNQPKAEGTWLNRITATTADDPNLANNVATVNAVVSNNADLALTATVAPSIVQPGGQLVYTITLHNSGPAMSDHPVITATMPAGAQFVSTSEAYLCSGAGNLVTCQFGWFFEGYTMSIDIKATAPANAGTYTTTFGVTAPNDSLTANNSASATFTVPPGDAADLSATVHGPQSIDRGTPFTYTIDVRNVGPAAATDVLVAPIHSFATVLTISSPTLICVSGSLPQCIAPSMAAGTRATITITAIVDSVLSDDTALLLGADVSSRTADSNSGNNHVSYSAFITPLPSRVGISMSAPSLVAPSTPFVVHIVLVNHDRNSAPSFEVHTTSLLPGVTLTGFAGANCELEAGDIVCRGGALDPGQQLAFDLTFAAAEPGQAQFLSTVANSIGDQADPPDNRASASVLVGVGRRRPSR